MILRRLLVLLLVGLAGAVSANGIDTSAGFVRVERLVQGLREPWGIAPLPDGAFLVTERGGRMYLVRGGTKTALRGVPDVVARGQGGLLDVTAARDFAASREVFLTYSRPGPGGASTALAVGRLSPDGRALQDLRVLFTASPISGAGRHFGSRVVEARDGSLFLTIGDRGDAARAQDLASHSGKVLRLARGGGPAPGNPFTGREGARPEIWSLGHRNPQGAALGTDGRLIAVEHGARGGDEVNRIRKGANYGWPVISYGRHYNGRKIGEGTAKPGMEQPAHYWDPSIAPSGLMIYSGKLWPEWRGDIFVGSLKFHHISRLTGNPLREVERFRGGETRRVRDIVEAPDGSIWFISVGNGAVYRMTPG